MQKSVPFDGQRGGPGGGAGWVGEVLLEIGTESLVWKVLKPDMVGPKGWKGGTC